MILLLKKANDLMSDPSAGPAGVRIKLWDGPVRIIHWSLVGLLGFSWWSAENSHMDWHLWSGYLVLALAAFRIYWGFAGGGAARFSHFVKGPKAMLAYARTLHHRNAAATVGHNPVGAVSVLALLLNLITQVVSGLFAVDVDGLESGPLSYLVSFDVGRIFAKLHEISFTILQGLVGMHIAAVVFYLLYKRVNLIGPMITGRRHLPADPGLEHASRRRLAAGVLLAAGLMWIISKGFRIA